MRHELFIEGMSCDHCVRAIDLALRKVPGVDSVEVELGHATIEGAALNVEALQQVVESEGYRLKPA